jgi:hypothetical protein
MTLVDQVTAVTGKSRMIMIILIIVPRMEVNMQIWVTRRIVHAVLVGMLLVMVLGGPAAPSPALLPAPSPVLLIVMVALAQILLAGMTLMDQSMAAIGTRRMIMGDEDYDKCATCGHEYENMGHTANSACCACRGDTGDGTWWACSAEPSAQPSTQRSSTQRSSTQRSSNQPSTQPSTQPSFELVSHDVCENFAVHAQTTVTFDGTMSTIYGGDVGVSPGTSVTGSYAFGVVADEESGRVV